MADSTATFELYEEMKSTMHEKELEIGDLWSGANGGHSKGIDIHTITATTDDIDEDGFFYGRHVVLTNTRGC